MPSSRPPEVPLQLLGTSPSTRKPDTRVVDFACQQLFCPGSCLEFSDQFLELKRELGIASIHFTGGGSNYMPWWPGLGYVWGADGTSEEGGTIRDPAELSRELAWMLLNGQGHHNFYYSAVDYMRLEQKTGWFTHHRRLLELVGKAGWQKPPVAVLRAAHSALYFPYDERGHAWDLGAGALQAAHYQNVYVTEAELKAGLADDYPVVFDAATRVMDDEILAGIERYRTPWPRYPGEKARGELRKTGPWAVPRDANGGRESFSVTRCTMTMNLWPKKTPAPFSACSAYSGLSPWAPLTFRPASPARGTGTPAQPAGERRL